MLRMRGLIMRSVSTALGRFNTCISRLITTSQYLNVGLSAFLDLTNTFKGSPQVIRDRLTVPQALQDMKRNCTWENCYPHRSLTNHLELSNHIPFSATEVGRVSKFEWKHQTRDKYGLWQLHTKSNFEHRNKTSKRFFIISWLMQQLWSEHWNLTCRCKRKRIGNYIWNYWVSTGCLQF